MLKLKRIYEKPSPDDGSRVLVDRLWPRGISKKRAALALWLKDIAPSPDLRKWFGHDPAKWEEFAKRYQAEMKNRKDLLQHLNQLADKETVTLVYAARDEQHNAAVVLKKQLARGQ